MYRKPILPFVLLIPLALQAQFEQRASLNVSGGVFKTLGKKTYMPEWGTSEEDREPYQMSNYKPGISAAFSFQYNVNRHFSVLAELDYMHSSSWKYIAYEDWNYLDWELYDTINDDVLRAGSDELNLTSLGIGLGAKYYLLPDKKINPYLYAMFSYQMSKADYTNNRWTAEDELGLLDPDDSGPWDPFLKESSGLGIHPGIGAEYGISDRLGIFLDCSYLFISMKKENFETPEQEENLHSLHFRAGIRFSFWKSKQL